MATKNAARSSLMQDEVGSLEVGKKADVILLDRYDWGFLPLHDPIQQIAFSANSDSVQTSIVGGRVVMRDRKLALIDEEAIRSEISEAAEKFRRDYCPVMSAGAAEVRVAARDDATLSILVLDRGPGIPAAELDAVLQPFYRLESSRNRDTGGTGLGLAIAHQLAQALGGTLILSNREGGGLSAAVRIAPLPSKD